MAFKKINIVLFPEDANRIKQFKIPRFLIVFFALFLFSCAAFLFLMLQDYPIMKAQMHRLAQLKKENEAQKKQFIYLAGQINQMTQKMGELQEFDRRVKIMVNLEASDDNTHFQGIGSLDTNNFQPDYSMAKTHHDLVRLMHRSLDNLNKEIAFDKQDKIGLHKFLENQKLLLASTPSIWPIKGWLSSPFGYRISPFTEAKEFHRGIDISARMNAPIVAPADGIISSVRWDHISGKVISLSHGYGLVTRYAHLEKTLVKKGQVIKRGEIIALVGTTGRSTGPHVHYEVHLNGAPANPLRYILN